MSDQQATADEAVSTALNHVQAYASTALTREQAQYGPIGDRDDFIQEVQVCWLQAIGGIKPDTADHLDQRDSIERTALRLIVRQALGRYKYASYKNSAREQLSDDLPDPKSNAAMQYVEVCADLSLAIARLSPLERSIVLRRKSGATFQVIAVEENLPPQRVWDVYREALKTLKKILDQV